LAAADPSLQIAVLEAEHAGFGASGRNGGWLSGLMPGDRNRLALGSTERGGAGREGVVALQRHLIDTVRDVIDLCAGEGIDADIQAGGTLAIATTAAQLHRLRVSLHEDREWGLGPEDQWELTPNELGLRLAVPGAVGALFNPHCARIQPAKLVRGLTDAVTRRGVTIYEHTQALSIEAGRVRTARGDVRARWAVRATEGFTAKLPGLHRKLLPMNSSMIVTDPLPPATWDRLGWAGHETVRDGAHAYVYAQRTADGRIAIGGRGAPYRFGSRLDTDGRTPAATASQLTAALRSLLPGVGETGVAHAWSGVLGVARDWCPAVGVQPDGDGGLAWAGGYVGDGVATSHLAGFTLADLILGRQTSRTALPWVGHTSPAWEPEPFRWLGVHSVYALFRAADRAERRRPSVARTSRLAAVADRIAGQSPLLPGG